MVDQSLRAELRTILENDQKIRMQMAEVQKTYGRESPQMNDLWKIQDQNDATNRPRVEAILDQRGWLGPDVVGEDGSRALFLVIQHADLKVQEKYLPMLRAAVRDKKAQAQDLALLEDRVAIREGRRQIYGSQMSYNPKTKQEFVEPLDDPDNVDIRRASVGLPPLGEMLKHHGMVWDPAEYKKQLPELEKLFH